MTHFGTTADGRDVDIITLRSDALSVKILTYGAIVNDVRLVGVDHSLTLGSSDLSAYEGPMGCFGSLIGPVANRINGAKADIDGMTYHFEREAGTNLSLHSGRHGTQNQVWDIADQGGDFVTLTIALPDGQAGFPGTRQVTVTYRVDGTSLRMDITATSDEATLFNFANHSFWCLDPTLGYSGYQLKIAAETYTETDETLCPTGETPDVAGGPLDFTKGAILAGDDSQFLDTNFCLSDAPKPLRPVAWLSGTTGITMEMATTEPGLQVYDCATIEVTGHPTHHGQGYPYYAAPALEAQSWPDAPNHRHFPSIAYGPDNPYAQTTEWRFSRG